MQKTFGKWVAWARSRSVNDFQVGLAIFSKHDTHSTHIECGWWYFGVAYRGTAGGHEG